jgi:hypothetical protein
MSSLAGQRRMKKSGSREMIGRMERGDEDEC